MTNIINLKEKKLLIEAKQRLANNIFKKGNYLKLIEDMDSQALETFKEQEPYLVDAYKEYKELENKDNWVYENAMTDNEVIDTINNIIKKKGIKQKKMAEYFGDDTGSLNETYLSNILSFKKPLSKKVKIRMVKYIEMENMFKNGGLK